MFSNLFTYDGIAKILIDTLLISVPEVFFWVMFTLTLVGEFEYWKEPECKRLINKFDYVRVFLPTIVVALLINIMDYMGLNMYISQLISISVFYIIVVLTNDVFGDASALKWMAKAFVFMVLGFFIIQILKNIYIPYVLYMANLSVKEVNGSFLLSFILTLPVRLLQYSLLLYFVIRKRTFLKGRWLKPILSSPLLTALLFSIIVFNILFLQIVYKTVISVETLKELSSTSIVVLLIGVVLSPIINIMAFLIGCYYLKDKEIKDKVSEAEKLHNLSENIRVYINHGNYDNIRWKLNGVKIEVEDIADSIYKDDEKDKHCIG
ncbi:hypothetical protein LY28_02425 [Ruminiclostridium sufflavum DSM 19573]|uniref:Uncharacterized protein n=1 Tax=Ruminiclostridium sufflavum DSM 19573 TaxID=1121337 RepID=A0A318XM74_9FIRM|nr:hypothetical protein [Ruminiclostridium sufflavum]PYG87042.1 hypothetical protein LY28_02425 [Ruminiclostridium sufflavum DSM 19573]